MRPRNFNEIYGQSTLIDHIQERISNNNFPQLSLFVGEEGTGKTTIARIIGCEIIKASDSEREEIIENNVSIQSLVTVTDRESLLKELKVNFNFDRPKVIILEEAHTLTFTEQEMLLTDIENIKNKFYVIALTTQEHNLNKPFQSRFSRFAIKRLTDAEMVRFIGSNIKRMNIKADIEAINIIKYYSEGKPRKALKVIESLGTNTTVTSDLIVDLLDLLPKGILYDLICSFDEPLFIGMNILANKIDNFEAKKKDLLEFITNVITLVTFKKSSYFTKEESENLLNKFQGPLLESVYLFYDNINKSPKLERSSLINAFVQSHKEGALIFSKSVVDKTWLHSNEMEFRSLHSQMSGFNSNNRLSMRSRDIDRKEVVIE